MSAPCLKAERQCSGSTLTRPFEKSYQLHFCEMKVKVRWLILKLWSMSWKDNNYPRENTFLTLYLFFCEYTRV